MSNINDTSIVKQQYSNANNLNLMSNTTNGILNVPKEYGMFIAS